MKLIKLPAQVPIIFLDFEGVLIQEDRGWSAEAMGELNRLCLESGAALVLSTSLRYQSSVRALHQTLRRNGLDARVRVRGETRDLSAYRSAARKGDWLFQAQFERQSKGEEIAQWLAAHPECGSFVVIDDRPELCAPYGSRTVVPMGAFCVEDRRRALELLGACDSI